MTYCEQSGCTGHLGKFDSCQAEALWQMSLDGTDETTGDSEFEGHLTLVVLDYDHEEKIDPSRDVTPVVTVSAGAYIVSENSQGFVDVETYASEELARVDFDAADERYSAWLDEDEDNV